MTKRRRYEREVLAWYKDRDVFVAALYVMASGAGVSFPGSPIDLTSNNWATVKAQATLKAEQDAEHKRILAGLRRACADLREWEAEHPVPERPQSWRERRRAAQAARDLTREAEDLRLYQEPWYADTEVWKQP